MSGEAQALTQTIHAKQDKLSPNSVSFADQRPATQELENVAPRQDGVMDEQFATNGLEAKDPRDREMMARIALSDGAGNTKFGKLEARPEDFKWLQKKQAAAETAAFQAWFAKNFDLMSPADKARAKELYPEFYAQRKKLLKQQTKNLMRLAKLKLEGIQNKDDLITSYLAETGRLDMGPLNHILKPEEDLSSNQAARFKRGLLSPFRVFGEEAIDPAGTTNFAQRKLESKTNFATRSQPDDAYKRGAYGVGFPPMPQENFNQGDKAWYELLSQQ